MIKFLKKHICYFINILLLAIFFHSEMGQFIIWGSWYDYIEKPHRFNSNKWYPIELSKPHSYMLQYQALSDKYPKCFYLGLDSDQFKKKFNKTHFFVYEDFIPQTLDKLNLTIKVYQDDILLFKEEINMTRFGDGHLPNIKSKKFLFTVEGYFIKNQEKACYNFKKDVTYTIKLINHIPFPEYQGIETLFGIEADAPFIP